MKEEFNFDIEGIKNQMQRFEYWIKEESLNISNLKNAYLDLKKIYKSKNQDIIFFYETKIYNNFEKINNSNSNAHKILENEIEFDKQIKNLNDNI